MDPIDARAVEIAADVVAEIDAMIVGFGQVGDAPPDVVAKVWRMLDRDPGAMRPLERLGMLVVLRAVVSDLDGLAAGGEQ